MEMGSSSSMKIVMALIFSLLLLGRFSAEAAGRINDGAAATKDVCFNIGEKCPSGQDCDICCKSSLGYSSGWALLGICCCQTGSMKV
ncbi:hypothetical protein MKW92_032840 [Papaver armeniacum]|nr:hypothetical protein MKW92_032840 [Papaver armeniacum]